MLGNLDVVDAQLGKRVAQQLGMLGEAQAQTPVVAPAQKLEPSPSLSLVRKAPKSIAGRKVAALVTDGFDAQLLAAARQRLEAEQARLVIVAPAAYGLKDSHGQRVDVDHALAGAPSSLFDALILLPSQAGVKALARQPAAVDWVRDGFAHLKVIGYGPAASSLLAAAGVRERADVGMIPLESAAALEPFVAASQQHRVWGRELALQEEGS